MIVFVLCLLQRRDRRWLARMIENPLILHTRADSRVVRHAGKVKVKVKVKVCGCMEMMEIDGIALSGAANE